MEVDNMMSRNITNTTKEGDDDDDVPLPGFRFHPTDEELVGFYLRRKVEKKAISIELIKQADIYKFDPWDLPKSSNVGDKDWYFFCRRGRKYKNSIRPNRVTGSGFWKATGIDRPIYSGDGRSCIIGLKKSLVYYRGSAGKGTKTEWMMHEFRLPTNHDNKSTKDMDAKTIAQEAEVWTLCRILKRTASNRKCTPDWKEVAPAKRSSATNHAAASSETCSLDSSDQNGQISSGYLSFTAPIINPSTTQYQEKKPYSEAIANEQMINLQGHHFSSSSAISHYHQEAPSTASSFSSPTMCGDNNDDNNELLRNGDWEDLRSIVGAYGAAASTHDHSINPLYQ